VALPAARHDLLKSRGGRLGRALKLAFAIFSSFGAASCLGVLGLDGYAAAPSALCSFLNRCYGEAGFPKCEGHVASQLEAAGPEGRELYLQHFSDAKCLATCQAARDCLDVPPVCLGARNTCTTDEQCCGFSGATATCTRQSCCKTKGALCSSAAECCSEGCFGNPPACGGKACVETGAACQDDQECCTGVCLADTKVCGSACLPVDFQCSQGAECCTGTCLNGLCRKSDCAQGSELCLADGDCCIGGCDDALGICGTGGCLPETTPCSTSNDKCCGGSFCDPAALRCANTTACTTNGVDCSVDDECCSLYCDSGKCACAPTGTPCFSDQPYKCCSRFCDQGSCADRRTGGQSCVKNDECDSGVCDGSSCCDKVPCTHQVCVVGESLSPESCTPDQVGSAESVCVRAICDKDPSCCCKGWDQSCVDKVATVCNLTCTP